MLDLLAQTDEGTDVLDALEGVSLDAWDWISAAGIVAVAVAIAIVTRKLLARIITSGGASEYGARILARFASYLIVVGGLVYALIRLGVDLAPILGLLGVVGLALAFAFQDILGNFLAGILLLVRRPFVPGDQIETNGHAGTVVDVNLRTVILRTFAGERVYVPNGEVLANPIVNLTAEQLRRTTLAVGVAYDTDLGAAQQLVLATTAAQPAVADDPPPEALVHEFGDSAINFAVRFWHSPGKADEWQVRDEVARALKRALDDASIELPFPQRTLWIAANSGPLRLEDSAAER